MKEYLAISCLPVPTFIEGNRVTFHRGESHPDRDDLPYFILIFMTKGELYIAENGVQYIVKAGEMFLLRPFQHHYSWQPFQTETNYYWLHFYVAGKWNQTEDLISLQPAITVPTLHYYTPNMTLHLVKHELLTGMDKLFPIIDAIFEESAEHKKFGFWRAQQLFIDVLQAIQLHPQDESKLVLLSNEVQRYLRDHYSNRITNKTLSEALHFHPNYITRALKETIGLTPTEFLTKYRMEEAEKRLLDTDEPIAEIAESVGFQNIYYFSTAFKKHMGCSPQNYRKKKNH